MEIGTIATLLARFEPWSVLVYHRTYPVYLVFLQQTIKKHVLKGALVRAVQTGELAMVKSSYKLGPESKKKAVVKKPKAVAAKKVAPKKKVSGFVGGFRCSVG
jgi:hypothetical protein